MKRRFAIPAAIALTAHALLFLGLGKPPIPPKPTAEPVVKVPPREVDLANPTPPDPDDENTSGGGGGNVAPIRTIEPLPTIFPGVDNERPTQPWVEIPSGTAKTLVGLPGVGNGAGGEGIGLKQVNYTMLDNPPRTRFQKEPVYPYAMKTAGTTGTVWVEFMVDETGRVNDVRVLKSTHPEFEEATRVAVEQWRFEPGKRRGIPVRFRMSLPVVFALSE